MMRRLVRLIVILTLVSGIAVLSLGTAFLRETPALAEMAAPTPKDVKATRAFVREVRHATETATAEGRIVTVPVGDLQGILRLGARFLPELRTRAVVDDGVVRLTAALPVPWPTGQKWLNLSASVPPFDGQFSLATVEVGGRFVSPGLALGLGRIGANLILGGGTGDKILNSASAMHIEQDALVFALRLGSEERGDVVSGLFGALRGSDMPPPEQIEAYYTKLRQAMDDGTLPAKGSVLPHLVFLLQSALADSTAETLPNAYTAALFALTKACGAKDFTLVVGRLAGDDLDSFGAWKTNCNKLTLAQRVDSKLHFITAAAIKAASNRGFAISMGEFKELHDTISGGSGFDFTDIAANNSGIRMSDLFMSQPPEVWPDLLSRMQADGDVIASFKDIPGAMPEADFKARYGDIDSPAYKRMLQAIEATIDQTALHASPPRG